MKHLALLAAVYALIAALVLPSSLFASEDADPAAAETPAGETAPRRRPQPRRPSRRQRRQSPRAARAGGARPRAAGRRARAARRAGASRAARPRAQGADERQGGRQRLGDDLGLPVHARADHDQPGRHGHLDERRPDRSLGHGARRQLRHRDLPRRAEPLAHLQRRRHVLVHLHAAPEHARHDRGAGLAERRRHARLEQRRHGRRQRDVGRRSSGAEAAQSDGGPSLPSTGADSGALLVLGALMLLLGVAVHRRARAEQPRPAGRIGW